MEPCPSVRARRCHAAWNSRNDRDATDRPALARGPAVCYRQEIANTRAELQAGIAHTSAELRAEIARTRADLIKWMFVFWVGQVAVISGILFAWLRR